MDVLAGLLTTLLLLQTPTAPVTAGRIAGRVTIEGANTPIASARITLFLVPAGRGQVPAGRGGFPGPPLQATTDTDGRFSFDRLGAGAYRIDVQKPGFAPLNGPGIPARPPIQLAAGQVIDNVDLHLQKGAVISGKVLDATGEPLSDARIIALRRVPLGRSGAQSRLMPAGGPGGQTNDLGEFRLAGLAAGEYYIAASPRMGSPFGGSSAPASETTKRTTTTTTFYPGTTDDVTAQAITVTAGNEFNNVVFTIQTVPAFRIFGSVVDENGAPVANAMVMLTGDPRAGVFFGPMGGGGRSGADGKFVISDVAAGSYRLNASMPPRLGTAGAGGGAFGVVTSGLVGGASLEPPNEVVVTDSDVKGARVIVRRNQ
jgi:hypothetical protein